MVSSLKRRIEKIEQTADNTEKVAVRIVNDPREPRPERPPECEFFVLINKLYDDSEDEAA